VLRLNPDWCDVALVLDVAVACLPPTVARQVEVDAAPDLPVVWADHDRLEQVFVNLLDNGVRHNPAGTTVRADAQVDPAGGIVVTVTDDGPGVLDDPLGAPSAARVGRRGPTAGAGLGLSIARGIVDAHGGRLELSQLGPGTRFSVYLPLEGPRGPVRNPEELHV
jgi:signal transduction histidine kinase